MNPKLARALGRLAGRAVSSSRYYAPTVTAARSTGRATFKFGRTLFLEIAGLFFSLVAVVLLRGAWVSYRQFTAGTTAASRPAIAGFFAVLFVYFAATSFYRARRSR